VVVLPLLIMVVVVLLVLLLPCNDGAAILHAPFAPILVEFQTAGHVA
jgi:hypothetical protein